MTMKMKTMKTQRRLWQNRTLSEALRLVSLVAYANNWKNASALCNASPEFLSGDVLLVLLYRFQ